MSGTSGKYTIDENNPLLKKLQTEETATLNDIGTTYNSMISDSDSFYNTQINAVNDFGERQKELQQFLGK